MSLALTTEFNRRAILQAAPDYEEDFAFYSNCALWERINCFAYALRYTGRDFAEIDKHIGSSYNKNLYSRIPRMLSYTNVLLVRGNNFNNIPEGYYPIAGFIHPNPDNRLCFNDYHWLRLDNDGLWSHKQGWGFLEAEKKDSGGILIQDPINANLSSLTDTYVYTRFFGFFAVPKGGVTFFEQSKTETIPKFLKHIKKTIKNRYKPISP